MSKPQSPRKVAANEAFASVRGVKGSVQKAQLVLGLVRGKKVEQALNDLSFSKKRLAEATKKLLLSAVANAETNHGLNVDKLVVARAYADKSVVMKRWTSRARGRAAGVQKPRCHITLVVAEQAAAPKAEAKPATPKAGKQPAAKKPAAKKPATTTKATEAKEEKA